MTRMAKVLKALGITAVAILLIALLGCAGIADKVFPCWVDEDAASYADEKTKSLLPWTTIADAERIMLKIAYVHETEQIILNREKLDDKRLFGLVTESQSQYIDEAKELRDNFLDPSKPGGLLLATLLGGTFGALAIPRPGDQKKKVV